MQYKSTSASDISTMLTQRHIPLNLGLNTFSLFVAVPSVPVRQLKILLTFVPVMYLLKHALALITALQLSLLTSQTAAKVEDVKNVSNVRENGMCILTSWLCIRS